MCSPWTRTGAVTTLPLCSQTSLSLKKFNKLETQPLSHTRHILRAQESHVVKWIISWLIQTWNIPTVATSPLGQCFMPVPDTVTECPHFLLLEGMGLGALTASGPPDSLRDLSISSPFAMHLSGRSGLYLLWLWCGTGYVQWLGPIKMGSESTVNCMG